MKIKTDVLVIGSGIAGCSVALAAANKNCNVVMLCKGEDFSSTNTANAQGGIIYKGDNDSPELLYKDIMEAGVNINNPEAVKFLTENGPNLVEEILINKINVPFDKESRKNLDITEEAAHSIPRIIHAKDLTGKAIQDSFVPAVKNNPNIKIIYNATVIDLLTLSHHSTNPQDIYKEPTCVGAYVYLQNENKVIPIIAKQTVLATGGLGRLFLHTTNPPDARGDGIAMAYRAGARLINLEYIQFHPTALYTPNGERFLISESVRGEGGILIRKNGDQFMKKYHPLESLAPRDVVARAIHTEMLKNDEPCVYVDISQKNSAWIKKRFPNIYKECLSKGIDMTNQPIPVVPAAHFSCGGVAVNIKSETSIKRLCAVGEVACTGLHGANRLASTSLLEGLVFGTKLGERLRKEISQIKHYPCDIELWKYEKEKVDPALIRQDWLSIRHTMWNYVGLIRSNKLMNRALTSLKELQFEVESFYDKAELSDELIGLRNGIQSALAILYAAMENHKSCGCHYRT